MILDLIGVFFIVFYFIRGYAKGIIVATFSVLALLLGILCSLTLSHKLSVILVENGIMATGRAEMVSYIFLFIIVVLIVRTIANILQKAAQNMMLGGVNMMIGGILYAFLGAVLWSAMLWIGTHIEFITPRATGDSKTYALFSGVAPWFFITAGKLLPFAKDAFSNLTHFLNSL